MGKDSTTSVGIEMKILEELGFSHEPGKRANLAFIQNVHPLHVDLSLKEGMVVWGLEEKKTSPQGRNKVRF